MKVTATVNGIEAQVYFRKGNHNQKRNIEILKGLVKAQEKEWIDSNIFVGNFPERGRYLIKSSGFISIQAGG